MKNSKRSERFKNFKELSKDLKDKRPYQVFVKLDTADGQETEEKLMEIRLLLDQIDSIPTIMKNSLESKYRMLRKRLDTSVPVFFGERVKELRTTLGLSLAKASAKTGDVVSHSYWHRIETGEKRRIGTHILKAMADALNVSVQELLELATEKEKQEVLSLNQAIMYNRIQCREHELTIDQKKQLVTLLDVIHQSEWDQETILDESHKIVKLISTYKSQF
ncbi:helix-turn-helix domain-containing protein [Bacillus sp. AK128]